MDYSKICHSHNMFLKEYTKEKRVKVFDNELNIPIEANKLEPLLTKLKVNAPVKKSQSSIDLPLFHCWFLEVLHVECNSIITSDERLMKFTNFTIIDGSVSTDANFEAILKEALMLFFRADVVNPPGTETTSGVKSLRNLHERRVLPRLRDQVMMMREIFINVTEGFSDDDDDLERQALSKRMLKLGSYYIPQFAQVQGICSILVYSYRTLSKFFDRHSSSEIQIMIEENEQAKSALSKLDEITRENFESSKEIYYASNAKPRNRYESHSSDKRNENKGYRNNTNKTGNGNNKKNKKKKPFYKNKESKGHKRSDKIYMTEARNDDFEEYEMMVSSWFTKNQDASFDDVFIMDSGSSIHVVKDIDLLKSHRPVKRKVQITTINGTKHEVECSAIGSIQLTSSIVINDVMYIPSANGNIISIPKLLKTDRNLTVSMDNKKTVVRLRDKEEIVAEYDNSRQLYLLDNQRFYNYLTLEQSRSDINPIKKMIMDIHRSFCHTSAPKTYTIMCEKYPKVTVTLSTCAEVISECHTCNITNLDKSKTIASAIHSKRIPGESIAIDMFYMKNGEYGILATDTATLYSIGMSIRRKSEPSDTVIHILQRFKVLLKALGLAVINLKADNEVNTKKVSEYLLAHGIGLNLTGPDASFQNGLAEVQNRIIRTKINAVLLESGVPDTFWAYAFAHVIYIKNHFIHNGRTGDDTPASIMERSAIRDYNVHTFGALTYVYDHRGSKLSKDHKVGIFLGYNHTTANAHVLINDEVKRTSYFKVYDSVYPFKQNQVNNLTHIVEGKVKAKDTLMTTAGPYNSSPFGSYGNTEASSHVGLSHNEVFNDTRTTTNAQRSTMRTQQNHGRHDKTNGQNTNLESSPVPSDEDDVVEGGTDNQSSVSTCQNNKVVDMVSEIKQMAKPDKNADQEPSGIIESQRLIGENSSNTNKEVATRDLVNNRDVEMHDVGPVETNYKTTGRSEDRVATTDGNSSDHSELRNFIKDSYFSGVNSHRLKTGKIQRLNPTKPTRENSGVSRITRARRKQLAQDPDTTDLSIRDQHMNFYIDNLIQKESSKIKTKGKKGKHTELPTSYEEAWNHPTEYSQWRTAIGKEIAELEFQDTYKEIPANKCPNKLKRVTGRWIFTKKNDPDGRIKYKARIVARGFLLNDYLETYSPVATGDTLRVFLSLAVTEKHQLRQADITTAFLHAELKNPIAFRPPHKKDKVWVLQKALYGLKNSPRLFFQKLSTVLKKDGFTQSIIDPCILFNEKTQTRVLLYVDDLLISGPTDKNVNQAYERLAKTFKIKDLGFPSLYLGITIKRTENRSLHLSMETMLSKLQKRYNITAPEKAIPTPFAQGFNPEDPKYDDLSERDHSQYRTIVGILLYIANMVRLDVSYNVSVLSQYLNEPKQNHLQAARRVFQYLIQTKTQGLIYTPDGKFSIPVKDYRMVSTSKKLVDSDYPEEKGLVISTVSDTSYGNAKGCRSQGGYITYLNNNIVCWSSTVQGTVALSSTEAEYMGLTAAFQSSISVKNLLEELKVPTNSFCNVIGDNISSLHLSAHKDNHKKTKHIQIKYHYIRQHVEDKLVKLLYINTGYNVADCMTKTLDGTTFSKMFRVLFPRKINT